MHRSVITDKYSCAACYYVYDPAVGDPDNGIPPNTPFEELRDDWVCPDCGIEECRRHEETMREISTL